MKTLEFAHRVSTIRWHFFVAGLVLVLGPLMPGCQRDNLPNASILMRIGDRVVTVDEFKRDFNIYRTATGTDSDEDANVERELQIRFVRQMADQLVLLEHARAIGIDVTDRDLEIALEEIRRDYPDDIFEQLLLENAITLTEWKASLRTRLIIDRVIQQELEERIRINEEDMARFLAQFRSDFQETEAGQKSADTHAPPDKSIVKQLRRSKTETAYSEWIAELKERYPVEIDQAVLKAVILTTTGAGKVSAGDVRPEP